MTETGPQIRKGFPFALRVEEPGRAPNVSAGAAEKEPGDDLRHGVNSWFRV